MKLAISQAVSNAYQQHQAEYLSRLGTIREFLPYQNVCYNPYPLVVSEPLSRRLARLAELLIRGVTHIAESYISNGKMQAKMPLPNHLLNFLKLAEKQPYKMGTIRPDILFGANGEIKVCEINARFPLNGMTLSQWINDAASDSSYLPNNINPRVRDRHNITETMLARFPVSETLVRVAKSEIGGESRFFLDEFEQRGGGFRHVQPEELEFDGSSVLINQERVNNFILEIDREELMHFKPAVIEHIISHSNHINDVRTLILIHDKRILSLLSDESVMQPFFTASEHQELSAYLLQSAELHIDRHFEQVRQHKDRWVLKRSSGGRGVDLHIGRLTIQSDWEKVLANQHNNYMAQEYLEPAKISIRHCASANSCRSYRSASGSDSSNQADASSNISMNLVGSLPCFDGVSFGLGMFRASEMDCINVGNGDGQAIFLACVERTTLAARQPNSAIENSAVFSKTLYQATA